MIENPRFVFVNIFPDTTLGLPAGAVVVTVHNTECMGALSEQNCKNMTCSAVPWMPCHSHTAGDRARSGKPTD